MFNELIILLILIFVSGFFSGSEIAFVVVKKIKIEIRARKKNIFAKEAFYFTQNPQQFFSTILIANNVANIAFASISTLFLASVFGVGELGILIISSFILLIFGELIPKYLARELSDRVVYISAVPLKITYYILYPFVKVMSSISSFLIKSSNVMEENISYLFNKEDIELLVKESHEAGKVNTNESDIITKVLELGKQRVHEAMKPRTDIVGVDINQNIEDALSVFIDSGYSKLPVYEENLDNIKGVIYAYDLFKAPQNLKDIMREVIFVPETKKSFDMLNEFLIKHVSIAIVIDEFGGTAGIITIEDV
ncbi:MAG TPA: HlyC/CorC family transporter, partial [Ignavibacteria bacterium]|nr:HlyC/CorC family transporter [Ignavibacteria bacterium]